MTNYFGLQYVLYLSREIDYYNDLLPLCIEHRRMFQLEKNKIIVLNHHCLESRFSLNALSREFAAACDKITWDTSISRKNNEQMYKWHDVLFYTKHIKNKKVAFPMNPDIMEQRYKYLKEKYMISQANTNLQLLSREETLEYMDLRRHVYIYRIMGNQAYFDEIVRMERELTFVSLTPDEIELIERIKQSQKLYGKVLSEGTELYYGVF